jgi:hypothetical protein
MSFNGLFVERHRVKLFDDFVDGLPNSCSGTSLPSLNRTGSSTS